MKIKHLACAALALSACKSSTIISTVSNDPAKVYVDNAYVGTTPYVHEDRSPIFSTKKVALKKEGFKPFEVEIKRLERAKVGTIVGACFIPLFWIWSFGYEKQHKYELESAEG